MEYASGGELFDRIVKANRFSEDEARYFFQQLISGVAWCHREVGAAFVSSVIKCSVPQVCRAVSASTYQAVHAQHIAAAATLCYHSRPSQCAGRKQYKSSCQPCPRADLPG